MNPVRRRVAQGCTVAILLLLPHYPELVTAPFDSWTHLFFASHYLHGWFSSMDLRWYLGFPVTSYPPLAHQLLAVLSWPLLQVGWEQARALTASYTLLAVVLTGLYPLAAYQYGRALTSKRAASYGSLVAAVFSGWWVVLLGYGQIPTMLASVFTMFGGGVLYWALQTKEPRHVVTAVLLTALVPMTHHFTAISFLPAVYLTVLLSYAIDHIRTRTDPWSNPRATAAEVLRLPLAIGGLAVVLSLLALFPLVDFLLTGPNQPVIPHGSRHSWLDGTIWSRPQFLMTLATGTLFILLAPLCMYVARRCEDSHTAIHIAAAVAIVCATLSLGFTTPLPRLLYPGLAETLTYFRFGAWGGFVLIPAVGFVIARLREGERHGLIRSKSDSKARLLTVVLVLMLASQVLIVSQVTTVSASPDQRPAAEQIGDYMQANERWQWRYLTLGMGQELGLVGIEAPYAQTIDGNYNTGRLPERVPVLAHSGAAQLSNAKFSPAGQRVLSHYLTKHENYGLRFVFSADRVYAEQLRSAGFTISHEWPGVNVRVWHDPDVPPAQSMPIDPAQGSNLWMYPWGIVPLLTLVMLCVHVSFQFIQSRD